MTAIRPSSRRRRWLAAALAGALAAGALPATVSAIDDGTEPGPACGPRSVPIIDSSGQVICIPQCPPGTLGVFLFGSLVCFPIAPPTFPGTIA